MSLWRSYRGLTPRSRLLLGGGLMAYAVFGLFLSDKAEKSFGFVPTEGDRKDLREAMPRVHLVEREERNKRGDP